MPAIQDLLKGLPEIKMDAAKKKALLIYAGGALVIFVVYFYFFLTPTLSGLFKALPKSRDLKVEIKTVENDFLFEDKLKRKLADLRGVLDGYEKKFSPEREIPMILENLSQTAKSSHVRILTVTPVEKKTDSELSENAENGVYQAVPISITAQSGYHELGEFISRLENGDRYMQVSGLKIKTNKVNPRRHDEEFIVYAYTFSSE